MYEHPKWHKTFRFRYTLYGILFGLSFPILAMTIDFLRLNLEFSRFNLINIHTNSPIHFIVETAPFVLGVMAFFCGRFIDKIKEKNAQLTKASNFKDNFLASMSHEIRTPMAGIIGVVDLLNKSSNLNAADKEYLSILKTSSQDLMSIINDILDLSKLKENQLQISMHPVTIREACQDVKNLFLAISHTKNVRLILDVADTVPEILALDSVRIKQVLTNLVGNALKFSEKGTVTIRVSAENMSNQRSRLKFEVIDEGIGIQKQKLDMIFSAYKQIENYSENHINGTGLGLFICKKLVHLMKGTIGVESEIEKGSNFWFTIETEVINTIQKKENVIRSSTGDSAIKARNLHVLVVDDNKILCTVFQGMLRKMGCHTTVAHDGLEFIDLFKENVYDIILLDVNMPKMGGLEAMQHIRENFNDVPPIICASASALKGDINKYMSLGFDDYITKPFTANQLMAKLDMWKDEAQPLDAA